MFRPAWTHPKAHWVSLAVAAVGLGAVGVWVDLSPKVESDFFFSEDDPQAAKPIVERLSGAHSAKQ